MPSVDLTLLCSKLRRKRTRTHVETTTYLAKTPRKKFYSSLQLVIAVVVVVGDKVVILKCSSLSFNMKRRMASSVFSLLLDGGPLDLHFFLGQGVPSIVIGVVM